MFGVFVPHVTGIVATIVAGDGYMILDSAKAHITPNVPDCFRLGGCLPIVIPGGCTMDLQAIDVLYGESFKRHVREDKTTIEIASTDSAVATCYLANPTRGNTVEARTSEAAGGAWIR